MNETPSERHARETLQFKGFDVERIPCGAARTADYRVSDGTSTYLVEVTRREEDEFMAEFKAVARDNGVADATRGVRYSNALDGKIREKAQQLAQTHGQADFRVLWISAFHDDWGFLWNLLKRTLFGYTTLNCVRTGHMREQERPRPCLYYHHFSFRRLPMLDAVVLSTEDSGCMFVNALSARAAAFRSSKLYSVLSKEARLDPSEAPDGVLVVDPSVDRTRPLAQWEYLKERYGLMTNEMMEVEWRGIASL